MELSNYLDKQIEYFSPSSLQLLGSERSKQDTTEKNLRPFKSTQNKESRASYFRLFSELVCYLYRIYLENNLSFKFEQPILPPSIVDTLDLIRKHLSNYKLEDRDDKSDRIKEQLKEDYIVLFHNLLAQTLSQNEIKIGSQFDSAVLSFLVIKSISPQTLNFKDESLIQRICSGLIYNARLYSLAYITLSKKIQSGLNKEFNITDAIATYHEQYLTNNSLNYFEEITRIRAYTRKIDMNSTSKGKIQEIDEDQIQYKAITISITKLREFYKNKIQESKEILYQTLIELPKEQIMDNLNISKLEDPSNNQQRNFSFIDHKENNLDGFKSLLFNRLFQDNDFSNKLKKPNLVNNSIIFNNHSIKDWLAVRQRFLDNFLLLIHLTSGSPLRGTEISTIKFRNSLESKLRNIFWDSSKKVISINTAYSKSTSITRLSKDNIRFLTPKISKLLLVYLVVVQPFYEYILIKQNKDVYLSPLLFSTDLGKEYNAVHFSAYLEEESKLYFNKGLTLLPFRHLIKWIIKNRINERLNSDTDTNSEDLIEDIQANHSTFTASTIYSRSTILFSNITQDNYSKSYNLCLKYWLFFQLLEDNFIEAPNPIKAKKHRREFSKDLDNTLIKRNKASTSYNPIINRAIQTAVLEKDNIDLNYRLQRFYNNSNITFRSLNQKLALEQIYNKITTISFIAATGAGKSLIYLLPSYINSYEVNIVFIPLVALKTDLLYRCRNYNIQADDFNTNPNTKANLVFISIESIITSQFENYINNLNANKINYRFIFDEAHLLILQQDFRYIMKYISNINIYKKQIIFLTATFTTEIEVLIYKGFKLESNTIIRSSTERNNISYKVIARDLQLELPLDTLDFYLNNEVLPNLKYSEKVIIWVPFTKNVDEIGSKYKTAKYYANYPNKTKELYNFTTDPEVKILVATSAAGPGIDIPTIRYSIHLGKPTSLINFSQESGRIGRDNKDSISVIIAIESKYGFDKAEDKIDDNNIKFEDLKIIDKNRATNYVQEIICRRKILNKYFDNKLVDECTSNQLKCDLCLKRNSELDNKAFNELKKLELKKTELYLFRNNILDKLKSICLYCISKRKIEASLNHTSASCISKESPFFTEIKKIKDLIRRNRLLDLGSACFYCYLPQNICLSKVKELEEECDYKDIVIETLYLLFFLNRQGIYTVADFKLVNLKTLEEFIDFITTQQMVFNSQSIKAIDILTRFNYEDFINRLLDYEENSLELLNSEKLSPTITSSSINKAYTINKDQTIVKSSISNLATTIQNDLTINKTDFELDESDNNLLASDLELNSNPNISNRFEILDNLSDSSSRSNNSTQIDNSNSDKTFDITLEDENYLNNIVIFLEQNPKEIRFNIKGEINEFVAQIINIIDKCIYCYINNKKDYEEHTNSTCIKYNLDWKLAYAKIKDASRIFEMVTKSEKDLNNNLKSKFDEICPNCFLPVSICFKLRSKLNSRNIRRCEVFEELASIYIALFQNKLDKEIPIDCYKSENRLSTNWQDLEDSTRYKKSFEGYLTNKVFYKNQLYSSEAFLLLKRFFIKIKTG